MGYTEWYILFYIEVLILMEPKELIVNLDMVSASKIKKEKGSHRKLTWKKLCGWGM